MKATNFVILTGLLTIASWNILFAQNQKGQQSQKAVNKASVFLDKAHELNFQTGTTFFDFADIRGYYNRFSYKYWFGNHFYLQADLSNAIASGHQRFGPEDEFKYVYVSSDHANPINDQNSSSRELMVLAIFKPIMRESPASH